MRKKCRTTATARFHPRIEPLEQRCVLDAALARPSQFASAEEFKQYLLDTALERYKDLFGQHYTSGFYPRPVIFREGTVGLPAFAQAVADVAPGAPASFSQTNVQVAGVDEGDLVKTDGTYLYQITGEELD